MSPQGTAALYGVITFVALAAAFMAAGHFLAGWPYFPQGNRTHGMLLIAWYAAAAWFARAAGGHGARGATLGQAWRAGARDLGGAIKKTFMR